jgi:hypothetical protein
LQQLKLWVCQKDLWMFLEEELGGNEWVSLTVRRRSLPAAIAALVLQLQSGL